MENKEVNKWSKVITLVSSIIWTFISFIIILEITAKFYYKDEYALATNVVSRHKFVSWFYGVFILIFTIVSYCLIIFLSKSEKYKRWCLIPFATSNLLFAWACFYTFFGRFYFH